MALTMKECRSGMCHCMAILRTDVSEEHIVSR
jgi:hypothetical protein